ncbi:hypothetical protein SAY86_015751 [Trapa natans]|uniref:Uncharacterized protein n=1 Tax=Trapa natans TaxID=22666 RepID=A0AAN7LCJ4_TRANT|nr:hypothetical protein SAY86_015751 [Trapa natans]
MENNCSLFLPAASIVIAILMAFLPSALSLVRRNSARWKGNYNGSRKYERSAARMAPEAGGSWPLLGHLHLLGGPRPPHYVLADMADCHGPIFTIKLGSSRALVVSSSEVAKECLTTKDLALATRPLSVSSEVLGYDYAVFPFAPYGPYWRHMRKVAALELLSNHRIELLRELRQSEVLTAVRGLLDECRQRKNTSAGGETPVRVDMQRWFWDITLNVMVRMIIGRRFSDDGDRSEETRKIIADFIKLVGKPILADVLPLLRWLDLGGQEKAMRRAKERLDGVLQRWLDEHKANRKAGKVAGQDFMNVMLSTFEDEEDIYGYSSDTVNKASCMTMILAGTETTMVSMTWALSLLLNNKESLKKVQQELDSNIGSDRLVTESDLKNLPYLQAVTKETLRLYPPLPLAIPHEAIEDCNISGYHVPKGTRIILNLHKIHREAKVWPGPAEFRPERFLTTHSNFDVNGQNYELLPFGSGRRMCPSSLLALQLLGLSLASFLHAFDVRTPEDRAVDMKEANGMSNLKVSPLDVLVTPRLHGHVY